MSIGIYDLELNEDWHPVLKEVGRTADAELHSAEEVAAFVNAALHLSRMAEEHVYLLCLTGSGRVIGIFEVGHGICDQAVIDRRGIAIRVLLCGARSIIVVHNHPGGTLRFSDEDVKFTVGLTDLCDLLDVQMLDSVIVSPEGYAGYLNTFGSIDNLVYRVLRC